MGGGRKKKDAGLKPGATKAIRKQEEEAGKMAVRNRDENAARLKT